MREYKEKIKAILRAALSDEAAMDALAGAYASTRVVLLDSMLDAYLETEDALQVFGMFNDAVFISDQFVLEDAIERDVRIHGNRTMRDEELADLVAAGSPHGQGPMTLDDIARGKQHA